MKKKRRSREKTGGKCRTGVLRAVLALRSGNAVECPPPGGTSYGRFTDGAGLRP